MVEAEVATVVASFLMGIITPIVIEVIKEKVLPQQDSKLKVFAISTITSVVIGIAVAVIAKLTVGDSFQLGEEIIESVAIVTSVSGAVYGFIWKGLGLDQKFIAKIS